MSDVKNNLKSWLIGMLILSLAFSPLYHSWSFLQRGMPWMAWYFNWIYSNMECTVALIAMLFIWTYIKDFKKIMVVGIIVYLIMLSSAGAQFLH